jgi:hypothetical protein
LLDGNVVSSQQDAGSTSIPGGFEDILVFELGGRVGVLEKGSESSRSGEDGTDDIFM